MRQAGAIEVRSSPYLRALALLFTLCSGVVWLNSVNAQSAADNIRPVGQVCLAGQPCVGATGSNGSAAANEQASPAVEGAAPADPAPVETAAADAFDAAGVYQLNCFACHGSDALGAPQPGDAAAWEERMAKGMDAVMENVINGVNAMPARGICMTCSDEELRAVVDYMLAQ